MKVPALFVTATLLVLVLSGCQSDPDPDRPRDNGIATMAPAAAVHASMEAAMALEDVTYRISMPEPGAGRARGTASIVAGGRCSLDLVSREIGPLRLRVIGKDTYGQLTRRLAARAGLTASQAAPYVGQWVRSRSKPAMVRGCRTMAVIDEPRPRTFRGGLVSEIDEKPVRRFSGKDVDGDPMTLFIATTGEPLVIRATGRDDDGLWRMDLASTDIGLVITAPDRQDIFAP